MKNRVWLFSNSEMASGAEVVLKEYTDHSRFIFKAILTANQEVLDFFKDAKNIEVAALCPGAIKTLKNKAISRVRNIFVMFRQAHFLATYVKNNNVENLYVNNTTAVAVAGIAYKFLGLKCKVVAHIHDMMSSSSFSLFIRYFCKDFEYIAVSNKCKQELIEVCGIDEDKIHVAYNGVRVANQIASETIHFTIGAAGSITERKGLIFLAQAYKELLDEGEEIRLEIAYNYLDNEYWAKVKDQLGNSSYNMEMYDHDAMRNFYRKIDLLVVPSLKDPLPTSILEAMNYGVLVIGSRVDGIVEMLPKEFLFSCGDVSELKQLLKKVLLMNEETRQSIKTNNHIRIEENFSIEVCSRIKDDVLDSCFDLD